MSSLCNENNLNECGYAGQTIDNMDRSYINYCSKDNNIFSKDCVEFYNKTIPLDNFIVHLNKKLKEENGLYQTVSLCKNKDFMTKEECIYAANNSTILQNNLNNICKEGTVESKDICKKICESDISNDTLKSITCNSYYLAIILVIIIIIVIVIFTKIIKKKKHAKAH